MNQVMPGIMNNASIYQFVHINLKQTQKEARIMNVFILFKRSNLPSR